MQGIKSFPSFGGSPKSGITPQYRHSTETVGKPSLEKVLRFLNSITNANMSALDKVVDGKPNEAPTAWLKGLRYINGEKRGRDIIEKTFDLDSASPTEKAVAAMGGLGLELGGDPFMWLPFGAIPKAFGRFRKAIPMLDKGLKRIKVSKPAQAIGEMFNKYHNVPNVLPEKEIISAAKGTKGYIEPTPLNFLKELDFKIKGTGVKLIKKIQKNIPDARKITDTDKLLINQTLEVYSPKFYSAIEKSVLARKLKIPLQNFDEFIKTNPAKVGSLLKNIAIKREIGSEALNKALLKASDDLVAYGYPRLFPSSPEVFTKTLGSALRLRRVIERYEKMGKIAPKQLTNIGYQLHKMTIKAQDALAEIYGSEFMRTAKTGRFTELNPRHTSMLERGFKKMVIDSDFVKTLQKYSPTNPDIMNLKPGEIQLFGNDKVLQSIIKARRKIPKDIRISMHKAGKMPEMKYMTIAEINKHSEAGTLKLLQGKKLEGFMETDPFVLSAMRGDKAIGSVSKRATIEKLAKNFGSETPDGLKMPSSVAERYLGKTYYFDKEIKEVIDKSVEILRTDSPANSAFIRFFDKVQAWMKWQMLIPFPAYHMRNMMGNVMNNWLVGVHKPQMYKLAAEALGGKKGMIMIDGKSTKYSYQTIRNLAQKYSITGRGKLSYEASTKSVKDSLYGSFRNDFIMSKYGQFNEDVGRMANFLDSILDKKMSFHKARQRVVKALFDYDELTTFEKGFMRRLVPFYSWMRKNLALQTEMLVQKPAYAMAQYKFFKQIADEDAPYEGYIPDSILKQSPVFLSQDNKGKWNVLMLGNMLPLYDLEQFFRPGDTLIEAISPLITAPIEVMVNWNKFFERPLEKFPGHSLNFMGTNIPGKWTNLMRNVRLFSELDKMNPGAIWGTDEVPGIFGMKRGSRMDVPFFAKIINVLSGVRFRTVDMNALFTRRKRQMYEDLAFIRMQKKFELKQGNLKNYNKLIKIEKETKELLSRPLVVPKFE